MKRLIFLLVIVFVFSGCVKKQDSAKQAAAKDTTTAPIVQETVVEQIEVVKPETNIPDKSLISQVERDEMFTAESGWGFSVFDPQTKVVKYYTYNGNFLGSQKR